jgi:hypothetical protein
MAFAVATQCHAPALHWPASTLPLVVAFSMIAQQRGSPCFTLQSTTADAGMSFCFCKYRIIVLSAVNCQVIRHTYSTAYNANFFKDKSKSSPFETCGRFHDTTVAHLVFLFFFTVV